MSFFSFHIFTFLLLIDASSSAISSIFLIFLYAVLIIDTLSFQFEVVDITLSPASFRFLLQMYFSIFAPFHILHFSFFSSMSLLLRFAADL